MRGTKSPTIAAGVLSSVLAAAPGSADDLSDSLASIRRAMAGHWAGQLNGTDAGTGEQFEADDAFTFAVTSEDGLNSATWSAETLEIATYEGDGLYRIRSWNRAGRASEIQLRVHIVAEPDDAGNGALSLEGEWRNPDGTLMEARERFTLDGDTLRLSVEMRPAGSDEPFETTVTGEWSRQSADAAADLAAELIEMGRRDQEVRERLVPLIDGVTDGEPLPPEFAAMLEADDANFRRLDEIVAKHGWPDAGLVGEEASRAALLVLEHADLERQKRYLPILRRAVTNGRESAANLAQLEDEISMAEHGAQIYGTEIEFVDGNLSVAPVIDPPMLDERRASVGLPPIEVYLEQAEAESGRRIDRSNLNRRE